MLYLLLLYACISFVCLLTGILIYECFSTPGRSLILYMITGLIVLTGITQWLILLMPLSAVVNAVIIAVPVILSIYYRKRVIPKLASLKKFGYPGLICFCCFLIMILT